MDSGRKMKPGGRKKIAFTWSCRLWQKQMKKLKGVQMKEIKTLLRRQKDEGGLGEVLMEENQREKKMEMEKEKLCHQHQTPLGLASPHLASPRADAFPFIYRRGKELYKLQSLWNPTDFTQFEIWKLLEVENEVGT